jgi:hypothetical protein
MSWEASKAPTSSNPTGPAHILFSLLHEFSLVLCYATSSCVHRSSAGRLVQLFLAYATSQRVGAEPSQESVAASVWLSQSQNIGMAPDSVGEPLW